jgi:hypothetical protein
VSVTCVQELLRAAETQTGVRPRRRPELVQSRITAQQDVVSRTQCLLEQQQQTLRRSQQAHTALIGQVYHAEALLKDGLSASKAARLQQQATGWRRRLPRLEKQLATCQRVIAQHQTRLAEQPTLLTTCTLGGRTWNKTIRRIPIPPPVKRAWMLASPRVRI